MKTENQPKIKVKSPTLKKRGKGNKRTKIIQLPDTRTWIKHPNKLTALNFDYSLIQLRVLLSVLMELQSYMELVIRGQKVDQLSLFQKKDDKEVEKISLKIPIKNFGVKSANYQALRDAMTAVATIPIKLETKESWSVEGLFKAIIPKDKFARNVTIELTRDVAKFLINTNQGFSKFLYEIVTNVNNKYTFRIYIFISSWRRKGGVRISLVDFRKMFGIEDKYQTYSDVYKRVIKPAYDDLFEKADCWFEVSGTDKSGKAVKRNIEYLNFKIIQPITEAERKIIDSKTNQIINWCKTEFKFKAKHIASLKVLITDETVAALHSKAFMLTEELKTAKIRNLPNFVFTCLKNEIGQNSDLGSEFENE